MTFVHVDQRTPFSSASPEWPQHGLATRLNSTDPHLLQHLHRSGNQHAEQWSGKMFSRESSFS